MTEIKDLEIKYISKNTDEFYVEKKTKFLNFLVKETLVFFSISIAAYFSIFISSKKFETEKSFSEPFNLVFEFFSMENLIDTSIGLFTVMGIISFANHLATHSTFNIQPTLNRLITAITDLYYLMFSTVLGCMIGLFCFVQKHPNIKDYNKLYNLSLNGIIVIGILGTIIAITTQYLINKNKIIHKY